MDRQVVRASYESCLDATARLSAYATSRPFQEAFEVNDRQDIIAADDLITFCIHARRLIENIDLKELLSQTNMKTSDGSSISLWKIIGCLIHHDQLMILRCYTRFRMLQASLEGETGDAFFKKIENEMNSRPYSEPMPPHVLFKSDQIHYTLIDLVRFIQIFSEDIMIQVIRKAQENGLYLQDDPLKDMNEEERVSVLSRAQRLRQGQ